MKAIRPKLAALLLTALLAALVLLPPHLALMQDRLLFGTLHTGDVPESAAEPSALSPPEKLAMICELYTDGLDLTTVSQTQLTPDPALAAKARAALDALAEAELLPPLDLYRDALAGAPCALSTAADLAAPERFVRVAEWQMSGGDGSSLSLLMDAESGVVYNFSYFAESAELLSLDLEAMPARLADYFGIEWETIDLYRKGGPHMTALGGKVAYSLNVHYGAKFQYAWMQPDQSPDADAAPGDYAASSSTVKIVK